MIPFSYCFLRVVPTLLLSCLLHVVAAGSNDGASLFVLKSATFEGPPPCSLNGELVLVPVVDDDITSSSDSVACRCDKPWSGRHCETLNFKPITFPQGYGMSPNEKTTWGGDVVAIQQQVRQLDDDDVVVVADDYHLFVSAMSGPGCSLRQWRTHSRIEHAVSDKIAGPFEFRNVAVDVFAHNPKVIQLNDGTWALIHIGDGTMTATTTDRGSRGECTAATTAAADVDFKSQVLRAESSESRRRQQPRTSTKEGSTIHISQTIDGQWTPLLNNTLGKCNNPAPYVYNNHNINENDATSLIYIVCSAGNHSELKVANQISGPWTTVSHITPFVVYDSTSTIDDDGEKEKPSAAISDIHYEDPSLYIDQRGFHILYHVYDTKENPPHGHDCTHSTVSAHIFSPDGKVWYQSPGQPYGTQVELVGGDVITVSTRERPSVVLRKDASLGLHHAQITHLITGVCSAPNCPDGPPQGCVNCKYDHWDYTLIQPLDV